MWATGVAWLWLHLMMSVEGEFGPTLHPFEPLMLQLHGLFLIPILLGVGGILFGHMGRGWRQSGKRLSGLLTLTVFSLLAITGYLLYYTGNDLIRDAAKYAHWVVGGAAPILLIWHMIIRARRAPKNTQAKSEKVS